MQKGLTFGFCVEEMGREGWGGGDGAAGGAGEVGREAEGQVPAGGPCGRWEGSWRWFSESCRETQEKRQKSAAGTDPELWEEGG